MAKRTKKTGRNIIIVFIVLAVLGGAGWGYFTNNKVKVVTVQVEKAAHRNLTETVVANGRIQPVVQVKISPEVSGEIIELPVREGQQVTKGDLLLKIKPDTYIANRNSELARFKLSEANKELSDANLRKAEAEFERNQELYNQGIISESVLLDYRNQYEVAESSSRASKHQVDVAQASLERVEEELGKTTIVSPLTGIITSLNAEVGERVVGTAMMTGTEIMTVADLNEMEARVDIGEMDVVLIHLDQKASLEVDAFRDRKFSGTVTEIASSSMNAGSAGGQQSQEATRFEVRIRFQDKELFRTGMSVTADIETRYRTNVLAVPIQCVTTRAPKDKTAGSTNAIPAGTQSVKSSGEPGEKSSKNKAKETNEGKPVEVVFIMDGLKVKSVPVKRGISDDDYVEILEGLKEGDEVVMGGYKAISRDLEDGMTVTIGEPDKPEVKKSGQGG